MKLALVTTTINIPRVLELYRAFGPDVKFFIALDQNSPFDKIAGFMDGDRNCCWLTPEHQKRWRCSELLGWKTIGRRSIAILEALEWGADIIVTIDDDNIPISPSYFSDFAWKLNHPFHGLAVEEPGYWWDVGKFLVPPIPHRGFPHEYAPMIGFDHVTNARIGVAAGICLGDPDISAVDRISRAPIVHQVSEVLRAGVAVEPHVHTVFNSQNTAFLRELAPCFLMVPQFGRYDDIFASLVGQRLMREKNLYTHFGLPFVWQQRNSHNLTKDLKAELFGMEHIIRWADFLDGISLDPQFVSDPVRSIWKLAAGLDWIPSGVAELGCAWMDDIQSVM